MKPVPGTPEHRQALKRAALLKILLSIALGTAGRYSMEKGFVWGLDYSTAQLLGVLLTVPCTVSYFWGLADWAVSKGYSRWTCLWGLLNCFGLIIIAVFRDRYVYSTPATSTDPHSNYPRPSAVPPVAAEAAYAAPSPFTTRPEAKVEPKPTMGGVTNYKRPY